MTIRYQNISLFHTVLKSDTEMIAASKVEFIKEMAKLKEASASIVLEFETLDGGEAFKMKDLKNILEKIKKLHLD